jgi:hypothetical protein
MRKDKRAFNSFSNRLTWEDFETKLASLPLPKRDDFLNASLLYQQALKCEGCAPNVAMLLLCSCAESMQLGEKSRLRFKKFYADYCPSDKKNPPIKYYLDERPSTYNDASFEEALDYIYEKFRCFYVHEGADYLENPNGMIVTLEDKLKETNDRTYVIDLPKILEWFKTITIESLYNFLVNPLQQQKKL